MTTIACSAAHFGVLTIDVCLVTTYVRILESPCVVRTSASWGGFCVRWTSALRLQPDISAEILEELYKITTAGCYRSASWEGFWIPTTSSNQYLGVGPKRPHS